MAGAVRAGRDLLGVVAPLLLAVALLLPGAARADDANIREFYGTFVGGATTVPPTGSGAKPELRDIDIIIEPYRTGFRITWVTVFRVDEKRAHPGVKRRTTVQTFLPQEGSAGYFRQATEIDMFRGRRETDFMGGDPIRWARLHGRTLSVYSLGIDNRGRYQLQTYHRRLTLIGLDIEFIRVNDGIADLRVVGEAARITD